MANLRNLQNDMAAMILSEKPSDGLVSSIVETPLAAIDRLQIHKNNFRFSLSEVLLDAFPVVMSFVGEEWLEAALKKFAVQYPPREACLSEYGGDFPEFLDGFPPAAALPYLADVARLEWAINLCQNGKDEKVISAGQWAKMNKTDMQNMHFSLASAHKFVESDYPLLDLWNLGTGGEGDGAINLDAGSTTVLVIRPESEVLMFDLEMDECRFLSLLNKGETVLSAAKAVDWAHEDSPLAENLTKYMSNNFLTSNRFNHGK